MKKRSVILGTKSGDELLGTPLRDIILGKKGDDTLEGGDGNDWLFGGKGYDQLFGGDGNDKLFGGKGDDYLDGGAGNDYLFGGKGDDTFNFTLSENVGAENYYDGGKGNDTLQLTLTKAEYDAAKAEIDKFEAFLADGGKVYHFDSWGLTVRGFEDVRVELVGGGNTPPVALEDSFSFNEDTPAILDVLANDTDADGDSLSVQIVEHPTNGMLTFNPDGTLTYTPDANFFGGDSFTYRANDGTEFSEAVAVNLTVNPVNDLPEAVDDVVTATAIDGRIRVAVVGVDGIGTHQDAAAQLDATIFNAQPIAYTTAEDWATLLSSYEVVVIGDSGFFDYGAATGIFSALRGFIDNGGGVVTTGWYAGALSIMSDALKVDADYVSPITADGKNQTVPNATINVTDLGASHPITEGVPSNTFGSTSRWVLANALDGTLKPLATGVAADPDQPQQIGADLPAIAYDDAVGAGRSVYLGGMYLSNSFYNPDATRTGVLDEVFEQAVAWAAGARGNTAATATIDDRLLLANDSDVETALADLIIDFVALQTANGASISLDANGDVVYTLSAEGLQQLLAGQDVTDSFDYRVIDGDGGSALASVNLTVSGIDTLL